MTLIYLFLNFMYSLLPAPSHRPYQEASDDDLELAYSKVSFINWLTGILIYYVKIYVYVRIISADIVDDSCCGQKATTALWKEKKLGTQISGSMALENDKCQPLIVIMTQCFLRSNVLVFWIWTWIKQSAILKN